MVVLSTLRKEFKQEHVEKGTVPQRPPVPFIPDPTRLDKAKRHEVSLKVSPSSEEGKDSKNTYKKQAYILANATPEDVLYWRTELNLIIKAKPCKTPNSKFDIAEILLEGDALMHWKEFARQETEARTNDGMGQQGAPLGRTNGTFASTLRKCTAFYFPKKAARLQKTYMRNYLQKPYKLSVKETAMRLTEINGLLIKFPGDRATPLPEDELTDILVRMCPTAWRNSLSKSGQDQSVMSYQEVWEYFERLEIVQQTEKSSKGTSSASEKSSLDQKIPKKVKRKSNDRTEGGSSSSKDKKPNTSQAKKHCALCETYGGAANTHNTVDCYKHAVSPGTGRASSNPAQSSTSKTKFKPHSQAMVNEELFAQMQKVQKSVEKLSKKKRKRRKYESSDSDSSE